MIPTNFSVAPVDWNNEDDRDACRAVREQVFIVGQNVRIVDGPFMDFHGSVDDINLEKGKVKVLVSFFGRETPVELDFLQVERL